MTPRMGGARSRAGGTAVLLLLTGAVLGITADRIWRSPPSMEAAPLTAGAMSERLGLTPEEGARMALLLDSLHGEVTAAAVAGPEALRAATEAAHRRIEASLPPESRSAFHAWMQEHRDHMIYRMHSGPMGPGMRHRGGEAGVHGHDSMR